MPKEKRRRSRSSSRGKRSRSSSPRRHKSSSNNQEKRSSSSKRTQSETPREFSFEDYKKELDILFFSDRDVIKKGTPQYEEFWKFHSKYQLMRARQGGNEWIAPRSTPSNQLGIPTNYHRSFLINFGLNLPPPDKLLDRLPASVTERKSSSRPKLKREHLMEFHQIILLYLEFLQREKMVKLKKLRESQEKLPIAQFKSEIIKAVSEHQIIIIAGNFHTFLM